MPASQPQLLSAREAYFAGLQDAKLAAAWVEYIIARNFIPQGEGEQLLRDELSKLWQGRIDRGELPQICPTPGPPGKVN
jgi:hypothetical protein